MILPRLISVLIRTAKVLLAAGGFREAVFKERIVPVVYINT